MGFNRDLSQSTSKPTTLAGRIGATVFFCVFLAFGLGFTWLIGRDFVRGLRIHNWSSTPCNIIQSRIEPIAGGDFRFTVAYRYVFHGVTYVGHDYNQSYRSDSQYYDAQKRADQYATGTAAMCLVNPDQPTLAYLKAPSLLTGFAVLFPLIFVTIGAGGILLIWRGNPGDSPAVSDGSNQLTGWKKSLAIVLFFGLFFVVGMGILLLWIVPMMNRAVAARSWPRVPCTVISSRVRSHSDNKGTTYSVDILYEYQFNGRRYRSNRYDLIGGSSGGYAGKQQIVNKLPHGAHTSCYLNPADPAYSALDRDLGWGALRVLFPFPFILVGAGGLWFGLRSSTSNRYTGISSGRSAAGHPDAPWLSATKRNNSAPFGSTRSGQNPITLTPGRSRFASLIAVIAIALFWNAIVGVFLGIALQPGEWFLRIFLIPFVLIGLGLIGGVGYTFLQLFNPRIRLTLSRDQLAPGESADATWQFTGRHDRITHLQIHLEGKESATYRRGTNTSTDHHVFADLSLADFTRSMDIPSGKMRLMIPVGTMHTLLLKNNKITWNLVVHAEIPRWPDVKESFPITVVPQEIRK